MATIFGSNRGKAIKSRKMGTFAALAKMLAPIANIFKGKNADPYHHHDRGCKGMGRMAFYAISSPNHAAHRRNWAH